jgi:dihydroorotate dehydrogenase
MFDGRLRFESPFGIAAGFDKNALLVPLYRLHALPGLGFSEVGSASALPSVGNTRPRCWRLPEQEAVVNFMGLNNEGAASIASRLSSYDGLGRAGVPTSTAVSRAPVGVNIAKTHSSEILGEAATQDFVTSFRTLSPLADFVVLNVSCPNTTEGKTFEDPVVLGQLLEAISRERAITEYPAGGPPPVLVKIAAPPETPEGCQRLKETVETIQASGVIDGLVISNTQPYAEYLKAQGLQPSEGGMRGGLSGPPLRARSTAAIREAFRITGGRLPIIGVGGVDSAEAAYAKIRAGASLVEVYTGIVYRGPGLFSDLHVGLRRLLERDGFSSVAEAVGVDAA